MRRVVLIIVLILSISQLGGCIVISCEECSQQGPSQVTFAKTGHEDLCAAGSFFRTFRTAQNQETSETLVIVD